MGETRSWLLGRILPRCAVGTTLLVKGLEFDHAVVLDADAYDARNLYVALTRGVQSLTVASREYGDPAEGGSVRGLNGAIDTVLDE